ncbi:uncharacterized protein LOC132196327 [Neocloeon triangulifer]|uniref:uncharacterized protein LOC132196327 n=1 Tax=Neocloeon triangulifer TaxID=2078957 RepID=UPI00286EBAF1|nr:uncharacterized protein LOC132196327 [Neocloeon triangulifer]
MAEIAHLTANAVVGFEGAVAGGLVAHPDGVHIIYPMGAKLVLQNWDTGEQALLEGHTSSISSVAISSCGKFIASGQRLRPPYHKASVILWDFKGRVASNKYEVHRSTVCGLAFSCDSKFLYSIGGLEDHCLVVWSFEQDLVISCKRLPKALQTSEGMAIATAKVCPNFIITSSEEGIKVWEMDLKKFQLSFTTVNLGKLKRMINFIMVDDDDSCAYCGSTTGDIVKVRLNLVPAPPHPVMMSCLSKPPPKIKRDGMMPSLTNGNYAHGVRAIVRVGPKDMIIAAGDGTVDLVEELPIDKTKKVEAGQKCPTSHALRKLKSCLLKSRVTSLTKFRKNTLLLGTKGGDIYTLSLANFKDLVLNSTSHPSCITSIAVPKVTNEVFVTCGYGDIRLWTIKKKGNKIQEASRILQPGLTCHCVVVSQDGSCLISAWDDGCIRFHAPQSGKLIHEIQGAHHSKVSALAITINSLRIISGGQSGQVRVWDKTKSWCLTKVFGEQRGVIKEVAIKENNNEAASVCEDGSCYVWKIPPGEDPSCKITLQTSSKLTGVSFFPGEGTLLLTTGMDRKVTCWDTATGTAVRDLETHCAITRLFVPRKGDLFVTGFEDGTIKVWSLLKGEDIYCGIGHGAEVTGIAMSNDNSYILSVSSDGSIFYWQCPQQVETTRKSKQSPQDTAQRSFEPHLADLRDEFLIN